MGKNSTDSAGRRIGRTPNYLEVVAPASMNAKANTISRMTIKGFIEKDRVVGIPTKDIKGLPKTGRLFILYYIF